MSAGSSVVAMNVGGVQHLIERAYREGGEYQYIRELYKNAVEAGATKITFGPEWQAVESKGVYRLAVSDNGKGMTAEELKTFLNTFGGGGKPIGDAHENYGVGSKTATLPWNHDGVVVITWTPSDPEGSMLWLCRDSSTGEYGTRKFETEDGSIETVLAPCELDGVDWAKVKPDWITDQGTVVVLTGNTGKEHTFITKGELEDNFGVKGISSYLNKRIYTVPDGVEVVVQELRSTSQDSWPRSLAEAKSNPTLKPGEKDRRWNRRTIKGAKHFNEYKTTSVGQLASSGVLPLEDGTEMHWFLWSGERPNVDSYAHMYGYIAAFYNDELYDIKTHHASYRRFGINKSEIRKRLTLIAVPPKTENGGFGVYPDTARNSLRVMGTGHAGESLPWDVWGDEFGNNMPQEILDALKALMEASSGSLDDSWKNRLSERFGHRLKAPTKKPAPSGSDSMTPGTAPVPKAGSAKKKATSGGAAAKNKPKGKSKSSSGLQGNNGGNASGSTSAKTSKGPDQIPDYQWSDIGDFEDGVAVTYQAPSASAPAGLVLLNRDFAALEDVIQYWVDVYPEQHEAVVRKTVENVYGQGMVARIIHSERLVKDPNWGRERVDTELRSPVALTMAVLGLVNEDQLILSRLSGLLGKKKKAS